MKILGSSKNNVTKNENGENVPHLEIMKAFNNDYQQDSRILYTFVPDKSFGQLLDISPKNLYFIKLLLQQMHLKLVQKE